jgi:hypothetical protein
VRLVVTVVLRRQARAVHFQAVQVQVPAALARPPEVQLQAVKVQAASVRLRVASVLHLVAQAVQLQAVQRPVPAHTVHRQPARPGFSPAVQFPVGSRSPARNRSLRRLSTGELPERTVPSATCATRS